MKRLRTLTARLQRSPRSPAAARGGAPSTVVRRTTVGAVALVAAVAAVVSYAHMQQLAADAGEHWRSHLLPLSVDGLLVAAAMAMLVSRLRGHNPSPVAWLSLTLGIAASLAANVAAAEPTIAGRLVAAWPPLALALAFELLMQQSATHSADRADTPKSTSSAKTAARATEPSAPEPAPTAPLPQPSAPVNRARPARASGKAKGAGAQQKKARALFERARAQGRADELTGTDLARAVGAHPGTARKWLAAWRAAQSVASTANGAGEDAPRLAVVGQNYPGGAQ